MTPTPHDALFRTTFSDLANLRAELERVLPRALTTRIDWSSLEQVPGTFVDAHLSRRESDLLFRVKIDGREAYIYVLFEHQSEPDGRMALRLLRYVIRIWERFERLPLGVRLPPIVPVVLSHSSRGWTAPTRLEPRMDRTDPSRGPPRSSRGRGAPGRSHRPRPQVPLRRGRPVQRHRR